MQTTISAPAGAPANTRRHYRNALRRPRRALFLALLLLLALAGLAGCGRAQQAAPETQDDYTVTFATEPLLPAVGPGVVKLTLAGPDGKPVSDARVAIEANMSHAGMRPVNAEAAGGQDGIYVMPLRWTMAGDWYVDVRFTLPGGQIIARRFPAVVR